MVLILDEPKNIIWIASYPKSGNTWLRFMICNLLFGRQDSASPLNSLIPDVHELGAALQGRAFAGLVKTHFKFTPTMQFAAHTAAAIYIVRHPADVIASNFHYSQRSDPARAAPLTFDAYFDSFIEHLGDPRWGQLGMGSWPGNVRSWLDAGQEFPVLRLRYEDLAADALRSGRVLAKLLRPQLSDRDIEEAVSNSSFDSMRQIEETDIRQRKLGIFYKPYLLPAIDAGRRFMRVGRPGEGLARLSDQQRMRLQAAFGPLLSELGYCADRASA